MCKLSPDMKWSFSKLEAFKHCGMMFKLTYLDNAERSNNGFSDYGTFCHTLMEEWAKGQCPDFALAEEFESRYDDAVTHSFPPFPRGMEKKYFDQGVAYFDSFDGFGNHYEVLTAEEKFEINIGGYTVVGIADLIMRNLNTGGIIVIDHKTKSDATMKKDLNIFRMQLYTYAAFVKQKFGVYPEELAFNMIRTGQMIREPFDMAMYDKTCNWIVDTIHEIEQCRDWVVSSSSFFCRYVCSVFDSCPICDAILYGNKRRGLKTMATAKQRKTDFTNAPKNLSDHTFFGLKLDEDQKAFANAIWNPDIDIMFVDAPAGSGKTTVAVAAAVLMNKYRLIDDKESHIALNPGQVKPKKQHGSGR